MGHIKTYVHWYLKQSHNQLPLIYEMTLCSIWPWVWSEISRHPQCNNIKVIERLRQTSLICERGVLPLRMLICTQHSDQWPIVGHHSFFFLHSEWGRDTQEITQELEMRDQREEINRKPICYMKNLVRWCGLLKVGSDGERSPAQCSWDFLPLGQ